MDESRVAHYVVFFTIFARARKTRVAKNKRGKSDILSRCIGHARSFRAMYENHFALRLCVLRYPRINRTYLSTPILFYPSVIYYSFVTALRVHPIFPTFVNRRRSHVG